MPVGTESGASPASRASGHFPGTPLDLSPCGFAVLPPSRKVLLIYRTPSFEKGTFDFLVGPVGPVGQVTANVGFAIVDEAQTKTMPSAAKAPRAGERRPRNVAAAPLALIDRKAAVEAERRPRSVAAAPLALIDRKGRYANRGNSRAQRQLPRRIEGDVRPAPTPSTFFLLH